MSTRLMGLWFLMDTHDPHEAFGHGTTSISAKTQVNWNYRYAWPAIKGFVSILFMHGSWCIP